MLKTTLLWQLSWFSFITIISIIDWFSLLGAAFHSASKYHTMNPKIFLGPTVETLYWVNKNAYQLQHNF